MINSNYNSYRDQPMMNEMYDNYYAKKLRKSPNRELTSQVDMPVEQMSQRYAEGGMIKQSKKKDANNPYPSLAEMIRQQGKGEDSILAHINPLEAMMLQQMGGAGTINPKTGLPQFGFFKNPKKWLAGSAGGAAGAIIGNMILPGVGGIIGGALGGAAGSAIRGRKDYASAGLRGASMGAALPSVASLAGSGAAKLGMNSAGNYLSNYGAKNAIMPSLGKLIGDNSVGNYVGSMGQSGGSAADIAKESGEKAGSKSWLSSMMKPKTLLTAAALGGSLLSRPKEKSPERLAQEQKRFAAASMLTAEERAAQEANMLADERMKRRIGRNKYLPEESFEVKPLYRKANDPDEYARTGKWINYYDNAGMRGNPLHMKKGGIIIEEKEIDYPKDLGHYIQGNTGGQEDDINIRASAKEFMIPADVVADIGDGNSDAGAKAFYKLIEKVRKHKGRPNRLPPKSKSLENYMR